MPKNKKPRKKHSHAKAYDAIMRHQHCQARVDYGTWGPHTARLWCINHNEHIQWLSPDMAPKWADALATSPGISGQ